MKTKDIVPDTYYKVATDRAGRGGSRILSSETGRVLRIEPRRQATARDGTLLGWFIGPEVIVRRFLMGGYIDVPFRPHDILEEADPSDAILASIKFVEEKVGPKPVRTVTHNATEGS